METRDSGTFLHQEKNMFDMQKVGERIAALRRKENMTQADLADKLGISFQAVSSWERGATMPDISKLLELSRVLGTSVDALLGGEGMEDTEKVIAEEPAKKEEAQASETHEESEAEQAEEEQAEASSFGSGIQDMMAHLRAQLLEQMENVRENMHQFKQQFASNQANVTIQQTGKNKYVIHIPGDEEEKTQTKGKLSADMIGAMAYNLDQDTLEDVLVDAINDSDEDIVSEIASYMEPETIDRAVNRVTESLTAEIMSELASYMGADALEKCAIQALDEEDDEMMEEIVDHLDEDVIERALEHFAGELSLDMVEALACRASEKALDLIIQKCDIEDSDVLEELSPYLNQRQMRELINRLRNA